MLTRVMTMVLVILSMIVVSGAWWYPWSSRTQPIRLPGTVEIQEIRLGSKVGGRVKSVLVTEGASVRARQPLIELEIPELQAQRAQIEAQIYAAENQLKVRKSGPRIEEKQAAYASVQAASARRKRLADGPRSEEIEEARGELSSILAELEQSKLSLTRELALAAKGATTTAAVEEIQAVHGKLTGRAHAAKAHLRLLEAGSRAEDVLEAQADLSRLKANAALLDAGSRPEEIEEAIARISELRAKLDEVDAQIGESVVKAPAAAVVEVIAVRPGDIVQPSQTMIRILEPDQLWVKAYVSEIELGKIRLNQTVEVTVDAYPQRLFEGKVNFISNDSEFTPRNVQTLNERRHQVFAIKVHVQDPEKIFKSGMAADVWIQTF